MPAAAFAFAESSAAFAATEAKVFDVELEGDTVCDLAPKAVFVLIV